MVWSRALSRGSQQGTPLVYDGVMYMPNPRDVIQAIEAATGDLIWEYRRARPADLDEFVAASLSEAKRNIVIYGNLILSTSADDFVLRSTPRRGSWPGRPRSLITRRIQPTRVPGRSSPMARSSRVEAVCRAVDRTRVLSPHTTR